jgi:hypothetical protein
LPLCVMIAEKSFKVSREMACQWHSLASDVQRDATL